MPSLTEKLLEGIEEIGSADLRAFCARLLLSRDRDCDPGEAAERERDQLQAHAVAAAFCARALCRAYQLPEGERDIVLAACLCCEAVAVSGRPSAPEETAIPPSLLKTLSIIDALSGGAGVTRHRTLFRDGDRAEIMVALAYLLRRTIFSIPISARGGPEPDSRRRVRSGRNLKSSP